jgi:telomerase reverse transcriptase
MVVHSPKDLRQVLMRWVDDYLLVTTNIDKARDFLRMMNEGHPEYGCFISRDKTYTNFAVDEQIMNVTMPNQERKWVHVLRHFDTDFDQDFRGAVIS